MVHQTSHLRGRPYVVRFGPVQFSIATDDERWAEEVCGMLPRSLDEPIAGAGQPSTSDPRSGIEQALRQLALGEGQFAVFEVPGGRNIYAQVRVRTTTDEPLDGEVVGNQYLAQGDQLSAADEAGLTAAGWVADIGSGNFWREWRAWTGDSDRSSVASDILDSLEAYGSMPGTLWIEVSST